MVYQNDHDVQEAMSTGKVKTSLSTLKVQQNTHHHDYRHTHHHDYRHTNHHDYRHTHHHDYQHSHHHHYKLCHQQ